VLGATVSLSKFTLVVEFVVMAAVLMVRPWGLYGRPLAEARREAGAVRLLRPVGARARTLAWSTVLLLAALPWLARSHPYLPVLLIDVLVAALFAASLHLIMGPGGMHSFGHAAYFGLGAYGAALAVKKAGLAMLPALLAAPVLAALGALLFGWFCVRLSGIYLAMLTLAFAQILWSVAFQWDEVTGGSNGLVGIWPAPGLQGPLAYYELVLAVCVIGVLLIRRLMFSPFGFALRAGRDSALRAEAIGIDVAAQRWCAFVIAATFGGVAGALFVFSKGSLSPETLGVGRSIDALVMVLLGGLDTVSGPLVGSAVYTVLQDVVARHTEYWRAWLGLSILLLVLLFPSGIVGWWSGRSAPGAVA
jgi:branched-chain amino acid transport system permease protein